MVCRLFPQVSQETLSGAAQLKIMSIFYDAVKESVTHVDGMVDRMQDREVTAWLGVPLGIRQPERAALEAALHVQRSFLRWSAAMASQGLKVRLAVGVASGSLASGQLDLKDGHPFVVLGDAIDKARQLAASEPQQADVQVRVCPATAAAVQHKGLRVVDSDEVAHFNLVLE